MKHPVELIGGWILLTEALHLKKKKKCLSAFPNHEGLLIMSHLRLQGIHTNLINGERS